MSAARALSQKSRLTNTLSIAVNEVRVALAAALLSTGHTSSSATALSRDDEAVRLDNIERGMHLHAHARAVLSDCAHVCGSDPEGLGSIWLSRQRLQASIIAGPGASTDVAASSAR
jgi:hypothetical protein